MNILIIIVLILLFISFFHVEGYININNIYTSNEVDSNEPDSVQFYACRQDHLIIIQNIHFKNIQIVIIELNVIW